jgi:hypothetical protein
MRIEQGNAPLTHSGKLREPHAMVTFNRPEGQSEDASAAGETEALENVKSAPWLAGSGLSIVLSVTFYLLALAADVMFDTGRHAGQQSFGTIQVLASGTLNGAVLPALAANSSAPPGGPLETQALLTQAINHEGQASASDKPGAARDASSGYNGSARLAQYERHGHRHALHTRVVTYNPSARPGSPEYVANLYRH